MIEQQKNREKENKKKKEAKKNIYIRDRHKCTKEREIKTQTRERDIQRYIITHIHIFS